MCSEGGMVGGGWGGDSEGGMVEGGWGGDSEVGGGRRVGWQ